MSPVERPEIEDAMEMVRILEIGPVRGRGLPDSALHRPRSTAFGEDAYPTLALKAAAPLPSLANDHALVDGNSCLAWLCTVVLCDLNDAKPQHDDEAFHLEWDVAGTDITVTAIAERLRRTS